MKWPFGLLAVAVVLADDCVEIHTSASTILRGTATQRENSNAYHQTSPQTYTLEQVGELLKLRLVGWAGMSETDAQNLTEEAVGPSWPAYQTKLCTIDQI